MDGLKAPRGRPPRKRPIFRQIQSLPVLNPPLATADSRMTRPTVCCRCSRSPLKDPGVLLKGRRGPLKVAKGGFGRGGVWIWLNSVVFGVWAAPGGFKTIQGGGGRSPPPFWMALKHPGAAQTPKTTDFQPNANPPSAKPPLSGNRRVQGVQFLFRRCRYELQNELRSTSDRPDHEIKIKSTSDRLNTTLKRP